jgi:hypothetical protein
LSNDTFLPMHFRYPLGLCEVSSHNAQLHHGSRPPATFRRSVGFARSIAGFGLVDRQGLMRVAGAEMARESRFAGVATKRLR